MERKRFAAVVSCAMLLLAACGGGATGGSDSGHAHEPGTEAHDNKGSLLGEPADPAQADQTIEVVATDAPFRFVPDAIAVGVGETVVFELVNEGEVEHEFTLLEEPTQEATAGHEHGSTEPNATPRVEPGETAQVAWKFTNAGRFVYECHVDAHHLAGMRGTITVRG